MIGHAPRIDFLPPDGEASSFYRLSVSEQEEYNAFPSVSIVSPETRTSVEEGESMSFAANASDPDGTIVSVEFLLDGTSFETIETPPYSTAWETAGDGAHELRTIATDNQGGRGYSDIITFHVISTSSSEGSVYPAETATNSGGILETTNSGYNGSSYFNFDTTNSSLEFSSVDGGSAGSVSLKFRYALGSETSRTGQLSINGEIQPITFAPTGLWTAWQYHEVIATLNSGTDNTVTLSSNGEDLANVDELLVIPQQ